MANLPTPEELIPQLPQVIDGILTNSEKAMEVLTELYKTIDGLTKTTQLLAQQVLDLNKRLNHFAIPSAS